jgi:hypothetical protein
MVLLYSTLSPDSVVYVMRFQVRAHKWLPGGRLPSELLCELITMHYIVKAHKKLRMAQNEK